MKHNYITSKESYQYNLPCFDASKSIPCKITFSNRKSISMQINEDGSVLVRAPYYATKRQVEYFINEKQHWIYTTREEVLRRAATKPVISPTLQKQADFVEKQFRKAAREYIPSRVSYYHTFTGGNYTSITIRDQKSRWGSCSSRGTLSFNYRLMMAPPAILDYVVVHELCHLTHMNHSKEFWNMVASILPNYKESKKWLKDHGDELNIYSYIKKTTIE